MLSLSSSPPVCVHTIRRLITYSSLTYTRCPITWLTTLSSFVLAGGFITAVICIWEFWDIQYPRSTSHHIKSACSDAADSFLILCICGIVGKDVVRDGGQGRMMQEEDGTHGGAHEGGMQAGARVGRAVKQQQEAVQVRRQGEWWVHVRGTPVARMAHAVELGEDEGMLQSHDLGEEQLVRSNSCWSGSYYCWFNRRGFSNYLDYDGDPDQCTKKLDLPRFTSIYDIKGDYKYLLKRAIRFGERSVYTQKQQEAMV